MTRDGARRAHKAAGPAMLWLCLHFPGLSLAVFERAMVNPIALAVYQGKRLIAVNAAARRLGLRRGMSTSQAVSIAPDVVLKERNAAGERDLLQRCAAWALSLSPQIALPEDNHILLEIGGSLSYFGGVDAICRLAADGLGELGLRHRLGVAPTARAAAWLAWAGHEARAETLDALPNRLAPLPVQVLGLDGARLDALLGLDVTTVGACLELPRRSLARRLGADLITRLDQALGREPELHEYWQPPSVYRGALELPVEVVHSEQLLFGFNRLIGELCGYLEGREAGVQQFVVTLRHRDGSVTRRTLGLLEATRHPARLRDLLRHAVEPLQLTSPVHEVGLLAEELQPCSPRTGSLFGDDGAVSDSMWGQLIEKLTARLGVERTGRLQAVAEHRPERAWRFVQPAVSEAEKPLPRGRRPLWLLPEPQALKERRGRPCWHGDLRIEQGPERIESGWWDGDDVARDYYVAVSGGGSRVWIFRSRRGPSGWFLHGIFA